MRKSAERLLQVLPVRGDDRECRHSLCFTLFEGSEVFIGDLRTRGLRLPADCCMAKKRPGAAGRRIARPNPFRLQHDDVRRSPEPFADSDGKPVRPWMCLHWLTRALTAGKISPEECNAALKLREDVWLAELSPLKAADPTRLVVNRPLAPMPSDSQLQARRRVDEAMEALAGRDTPPASAALNVIGFDMKIETWAQTIGWRGRPIQPEEASRILQTALVILGKHYGF